MSKPNSRRTIRIVAVVVVVCSVAVALIAFALRESRPTDDSPGGIARLAEFTLPDLDDRPRSIREWSGSPLILNFWATWCAPCRREMPLLQEFHDRSDTGGLTVIGIALDNPRDARRFVTEVGITYPNLYGETEGAEIADSMGDSFVGLPFSAFVGPGGEIVALRAGELHADELERIVTDLGALAGGQLTPAEARDRLAEN